MGLTPPIPPELWAQLSPEAQSAVSAVIATLEARIAQLEARLNQNSSNSSRPPSSDPPHFKPAPPRPTGRRRKGGQPGHPKNNRPTLPPDEVVELRADACRHCRTPLCGDDPQPLTHQVIEIPQARPPVTEYRRHRITCVRCRRVNLAPLPTGVRSGYGARVQAVCAMLSGAYRVGKRGVARLCGELFGVPISPAAVCKLQHHTAEALEPLAEELHTHVAGRPANVDETGWCQGRKRHWLWVAVTGKATAFIVGESRGRKELPSLIGGEPGVLTTDRHSAYDFLNERSRQICWSHLRRDFQSMIDHNSDGSEVGRQLLACADGLLSDWREVREGRQSREEFARVHLPTTRSRVKELLQSGRQCRAPNARRVCRELERVFESLWTFGLVAGVEPTNNAAERALRGGVCWRKTSYGTDSARGSRFVGRILSAVESCRQQGRNLLGFLTQTIQAVRNNRTPPTILPNPA